MAGYTSEFFGLTEDEAHRLKILQRARRILLDGGCVRGTEDDLYVVMQAIDNERYQLFRVMEDRRKAVEYEQAREAKMDEVERVAVMEKEVT